MVGNYIWGVGVDVDTDVDVDVDVDAAPGVLDGERSRVGRLVDCLVDCLIDCLIDCLVAFPVGIVTYIVLPGYLVTLCSYLSNYYLQFICRDVEAGRWADGQVGRWAGGVV